MLLGTVKKRRLNRLETVVSDFGCLRIRVASLFQCFKNAFTWWHTILNTLFFLDLFYPMSIFEICSRGTLERLKLIESMLFLNLVESFFIKKDQKSKSNRTFFLNSPCKK